MTLTEWNAAVAKGGLVEIERKRGKIIVRDIRSGKPLYEIETSKRG